MADETRTFEEKTNSVYYSGVRRGPSAVKMSKMPDLFLHPATNNDCKTAANACDQKQD